MDLDINFTRLLATYFYHLRNPCLTFPLFYLKVTWHGISFLFFGVFIFNLKV